MTATTRTRLRNRTHHELVDMIDRLTKQGDYQRYLLNRVAREAIRCQITRRVDRHNITDIYARIPVDLLDRIQKEVE